MVLCNALILCVCHVLALKICAHSTGNIRRYCQVKGSLTNIVGSCFISVCFIFSTLPLGPALYAFNNAVFTEEDWHGIQATGRSVKRNDPNRVGRFGIGFNSVYHITGKLHSVILCIEYVHVYRTVVC